MNHDCQSVVRVGARCSSLVLLLFLATTARPQPSSDTQPVTVDQITLKAVSELVVLPVSVTDKNGDFVSGLALQNFRVFEDGRLQKITFFQSEDLPVAVGLIVDHSHSMEGKLEGVASAISNFAHSSNPEDEMFVVDFNDRVWPELFGGRTFTSSAREVEAALLAVAAQGQTALYDAVYDGLRRLRLAHRDKRALIVVSDGGDNASRRKYEEVLALAHQSRAIIYAIGLIGVLGEEENPRVLERLCKDTGGLAFFPRTSNMVTEISNRIARDLREQYTIGYVPDKKTNDGEFRQVIVKVSSPDRRTLHVRTRPGYSTGPAEPRRADSQP